MEFSLAKIASKFAQDKRTTVAYTNFFASEDGQLIFRDMLDMAGVTKKHTSKDPVKAFQHEAVRNFVLSLMQKAGVQGAAVLQATYAKALELAREFPEVPESKKQDTERDAENRFRAPPLTNEY